MPRKRRGLLLVNVGTPDAPTTSAVRRYLREFLSDPRVVDIHPLGRWLLLNAIILPFRPKRSAAAYRAVWTTQGSPLLGLSQQFATGLQNALGDDVQVALGMRYGNPSIESALRGLEEARVDELIVFPLYPQFAASSTGSALERLYELCGRRWNTRPITVVGPFHADAGFLDAFAQVARPVLEQTRADRVLFSFHGLPERQIRKSDETGKHCLVDASCCDELTDTNRFCYRAQCFATARQLAERLRLSTRDYTVCFQSRLGRTPWISPYTDVVLREEAARGTKRLAVICPAFVSDCLETLEEVGIRARESFRAAGGEELVLVPSLNAHPAWIEAAAALVRRCAPELARDAG